MRVTVTMYLTEEEVAAFTHDARAHGDDSGPVTKDYLEYAFKELLSDEISRLHVKYLKETRPHKGAPGSER